MSKVLKNKKLILIIFVSIFSLLSILLIVILILNNQQQSSKEVPQSYAQSYPQIQSNEVNLNEDDIVFISKNNDIYSVNLATNSETKLTSFEEVMSPNINIKRIQKIDAENIGFGRCNTIEGDYQCGIYMLNLNTNEIKAVIRLNKETLLLDLDFYNLDTVTYLVDENSSTWTLNLFKDLKNTDILKFNYSDSYGRGGSIEDSTSLEFSDDGSLILYNYSISPLGNEGLFDDKTYIFDQEGNLIDEISNTTQSTWLDSSQIIYRRYSLLEDQDEGYLYTYDLNNKDSKKIEISGNNSLNPYVINLNSILFYENVGGPLWNLNIENENKEKLLENLLSPIIVNNKYIIYNEYIPCRDNPDCGGYLGSFEFGDRKLFNLKTKELKVLETPWKDAVFFK